MPTDVSGTIHIIAEVAGNAGSPLAGTGASVGPQENSTQKRLVTRALGFDLNLKKIVNYLTIGGLVANSKLINISISFVFRAIGTLVDLLFAPFAPILFDTLEVMFKILSYLSLIMDGEKSPSDVWEDFKQFWQNQWNEVGFVGILKNIFKGFVGTTFLATIFAGMLLGPGAGGFVLRNAFKISGGQFAKDFIASVFGLKKVKLSNARKGTKAMRAGRVAKRMIQGKLPITKILPYVFPIGKGAILSKAFLSKALSFTVDVATTGLSLFGGSKWKALAFSAKGIVLPLLTSIMGILGLGGVLAMVGIPLLLGIFLFTALVSLAYVANWVVKWMTGGKSIGELITEWWNTHILGGLSALGVDSWRPEDLNFLPELRDALKDPLQLTNRDFNK